MLEQNKGRLKLQENEVALVTLRGNGEDHAVRKNEQMVEAFLLKDSLRVRAQCSRLGVTEIYSGGIL